MTGARAGGLVPASFPKRLERTEMTLKTVFLIAVTALDAAAVVRALWRTQGVERTLMWVFAILAFPGVGALSFFLLANPSVRRTAKRKRAASTRMRDAHGLRAEERGALADTSLFALSTMLTGYTPSPGNRVELFSDSATAFARIESALRNAEKSIWAEYYIIRGDATGHRFLSILTERARAGIEVRLLYDAVGSRGMNARLLKEITAAGGRVEAFHPLNPLRRRWSVHLRNHRKLLIVDGQLAFTGSMNVGDEYSGRIFKRGGKGFRDVHLEIEGPAVTDLAGIFTEDWYFASEETIRLDAAAPARPVGPATVAALPSGPDQDQNASALVYFGGIAGARERVWLTSPYFIPDEPTLRALEEAALRGVDVRLLVPAECDAFLVGPAGRFYFPVLLKAGVRVFEYLPSLLHAKTMVLDSEWSFVGSANLDIRSFRLNFELGALVSDPEFARLLEEKFLEQVRESREVTAEDLAERSLWVQVEERLARLLSPLL